MLFSCTVRAAVVLATGGAALLRGEAGTNVGEKPWLAISTDWDFCFSLQGAQKRNHNREMQIQRYPSINQSICGNGNSYMTFSGSKEEQSKSICMRGGCQCHRIVIMRGNFCSGKEVQQGESIILSQSRYG